MKFLVWLMALSPVFAVPGVPEDQQKPNSFLSAVKKGDVALLRERIRARLKEPFPNFVTELFYTTNEGENIFHALAGVRTNQKEFSETLKELVSVASVYGKNSGDMTLAGVWTHRRGFSGNLKELISAIPFYGKNLDDMTLAGLRINPKTHLEHTPLGLAILKNDFKTVAEKMDSIFVTGPALSALSYLHGWFGTDEAFLGVTGREGRGRSALSRKLNQMHGLISLKRYVSFSPYLQRDGAGRLPRQIAEQVGNVTAFDVLKNAQGDDFGNITLWGGGISFGLLMAAYTVFYAPFNDLDHFMSLPSILGGMTASIASGAFLSYQCHSIFKRQLIKRRRILSKKKF